MVIMKHRNNYLQHQSFNCLISL